MKFPSIHDPQRHRIAVALVRPSQSTGQSAHARHGLDARATSHCINL
jgi:hypothetical protein